MANMLRDYPQDTITARDYFDQLSSYTRSHQLVPEDGRIVPWIDENLDPYTGTWIARERLKDFTKDEAANPERHLVERGKDYNHSAYCDLIVSGLVGLIPRAADTVEVNPLLPNNTWPWFRLDRVPYHGRLLTIVWDKTGTKYNQGSGLRIFADGQEIAAAPGLKRLEGKLPSPPTEK